MKAVKIAIIVLAPIVLVAGLWFGLGRGSGPMVKDPIWYDVTTGRFVGAPKSRLAVPAENEQGQKAIYPVIERDGKYYLSEIYREGIEERFTDTQVFVDLQTMELQPK